MQPQGHVDPHFQRVADLFADNFASLDELGASLCVTVGGRTVLDLWGGHRDAERTQAWDRDTITTIFSNTKAATALCAHLLIDRGQLDPEARVGRYWPEFAVNGKEDTTVAMLLNHTAGVPAIRDDVPDGGFADWDYMAGELAAQTPYWTPGTQLGYHMITFGWLVGELIRRVSGRSLGQFYREEVAGPLDLDLYIGLPASEDARVAPTVFYRMQPGELLSEFTQTMLRDTQSMQARAILNLGGVDYNTTATRRAEIGAAGGISNARALAGMFTPLATGGGTLISAAQIARMHAPAVESARDATLLIPTRFGAGFMLNTDNRPAPTSESRSFIIGPGAFGHVGAGGSCAFADPDHDLAFGYVMNKMGSGFLMNERGQRLIDAVYEAL